MWGDKMAEKKQQIIDEVLIINEPLIIDGKLYCEFCKRYGTLRANHLIIFYAQCKQYGDTFLRQLYREQTYYFFRKTLIKGGYLRFGCFHTEKGERGHTTVVAIHLDDIAID